MSTGPSTHDLEVPVLVVGAGPAGLTAALLLQCSGVQALTVTKYGWTANTPRAHYQNQRSLEILRELGLESQVVAAGMSDRDTQNVVWASSLAGIEYARIQMYMASRPHEYRAASPCPSSNIAQHLLEPIMAEAAMARGAAIRWGHELQSIDQDADGVTSTVRDRAEGRIYRIRSQYVIGADGARSVVAEQLGITHTGMAGWAAAVNVWCKVDLRRYCEHRPGILYWINRPGSEFWIGSGVFIAVRAWNEWVLSIMYDPKMGEPDLSEATLKARVRNLVGDASIEVEILAANPWQMNALTAQQLSVGRVFIAGDAAHRHPPSGGLGSNTSMQDSYNLVWKLKMVLDGVADPGLLDSYNVERQPVARQIVDRSMASVGELGAVAAAIGFKPGQTEAEGWEALASVARGDEQGRARRAALREALALQQYHFCGHGVELGVRYQAGAFVPEPRALRDDPAGLDLQIHYQPTTRPGAHLPHAWLERDGVRLSTLDIVGRARFAMLIGHEGDVWREAAAKVGKALRLPIDVHSIGVGLDLRDVENNWEWFREVGDGGCLLVRPDKVIAWRSAGHTADPTAALLRAMNTVLARQPAGHRSE